MIDQKDLEIIRVDVRGRFEALAAAQKLSAAELARRLDILNGEAERLRSMQATYLPREVYETKQGETERALKAAIASAVLSLVFLVLNFMIGGK